MLHNVTVCYCVENRCILRGWPMNKFGNLACVFSFVALLAACATSENKEVSNKIEVEELVFAKDPEPIRGKLDVYGSMARSVKYNVDVAAQETNKKLFESKQGMSPQDIIQNMMNVKSGRNNPLYDSLRALDYAVFYALTNLSGNRGFIDANIFAKNVARFSFYVRVKFVGHTSLIKRNLTVRQHIAIKRDGITNGKKPLGLNMPNA